MNVFRDLFNSKKFVGALLTMASAVAIRLGIPEIQLEEIIAIISPMLAYIGAQGFADRGKSVAILNQQGPS
tara:strand:- start:765 stop:977 length:213 start_codon:yes stop_codon:yes gene_type:complete